MRGLRGTDGLVGQAVRFAGAGAANTAITLALYQLLLFAMPHGPAYVLTWIVGLGIVVAFYPEKVFGRTANTRQRGLIALVYGSSMVLGLLVLSGLTRWVLGPRAAILGALAVTTAYNFMVMRFVLRH